MTRISLSRWPIIFPLSSFLGGNQRDTDRLRAQARHAKKNTGERKEGDVKSRNEKYFDCLSLLFLIILISQLLAMPTLSPLRLPRRRLLRRLALIRIFDESCLVFLFVLASLFWRMRATWSSSIRRERRSKSIGACQATVACCFCYPSTILKICTLLAF